MMSQECTYQDLVQLAEAATKGESAFDDDQFSPGVDSMDSIRFSCGSEDEGVLQQEEDVYILCFMIFYLIIFYI